MSLGGSAQHVAAPAPPPNEGDLSGPPFGVALLGDEGVPRGDERRGEDDDALLEVREEGDLPLATTTLLNSVPSAAAAVAASSSAAAATAYVVSPTSRSASATSCSSAAFPSSRRFPSAVRSRIPAACGDARWASTLARSMRRLTASMTFGYVSKLRTSNLETRLLKSARTCNTHTAHVPRSEEKV